MKNGFVVYIHKSQFVPNVIFIFLESQEDPNLKPLRPKFGSRPIVWEPLPYHINLTCLENTIFASPQFLATHDHCKCEQNTRHFHHSDNYQHPHLNLEINYSLVEKDKFTKWNKARSVKQLLLTLLLSSAADWYVRIILQGWFYTVMIEKWKY